MLEKIRFWKDTRERHQEGADRDSERDSARLNGDQAGGPANETAEGPGEVAGGASMSAAVVHEAADSPAACSATLSLR